MSKRSERGTEPGGGGEESLVLAAGRGELDAFDQLVRAYQKRATAVAYRLLNNLDDAMEIVQDAFLKAFDKLDTLTEPRRFGPWLLRIVNNLALNRRRARALRKTVSFDASPDQEDAGLDAMRPDPHAPAPDQRLSEQDVQRLIQETLDSLSEVQRQALMLFSVEKMPQREVAEILGCSVEAVKWHVFAARKKLKERLRDYL